MVRQGESPLQVPKLGISGIQFGNSGRLLIKKSELADCTPSLGRRTICGRIFRSSPKVEPKKKRRRRRRRMSSVRSLGLQKDSPPLEVNKDRTHKYPPLTKEQKKLVTNHMYLAGRLAHAAICHTNGHIGMFTKDDLTSIGYFALCVAATKYDKDNKSKAKFSTFAWGFVYGYIRHELRDHSRMIKMPRWIPCIRAGVRERLENGDSYEQIAADYDMPVEKVILCERSWHEIPLSINSDNQHWIDSNRPDISLSYEEREMRSYIKSFADDEFEELLTMAEEGDLDDPRIQYLIQLDDPY